MSLLSRIFFASSACENCRAQPAVSSLRLPTGEHIRLCAHCDQAIGDAFRHPLHDFQFEELLRAVPVNSQSVVGVPWRSNRDEVLARLPAPVAEGIRSSQNRSPTLLSGPAAVRGHTVTFHFSFGDAGLDAVSLAPVKPVLDAVTPLRNLFGEPCMDHETPSLSGHPEHQVTWKPVGFEVILEQTACYTVIVTYQLPRFL